VRSGVWRRLRALSWSRGALARPKKREVLSDIQTQVMRRHCHRSLGAECQSSSSSGPRKRATRIKGAMGMVIRTYTSHAFGTYASSPWLVRPPAPSPLARGQRDKRREKEREEVEKGALRLLLHVEERPSEHMEEWRTASPHCLCAPRVRHGLICDGSSTICGCLCPEKGSKGHASGRN
jgi:hypothetical protein